MSETNKLKIFNDPIYGFITIPDTLIFDIIEHPYFQRLRRISQMGLSNLVYPGAHHTRFHHALGCLYLMQKAISVLKTKGIKINKKETQALSLAILLHDLGHGPFSHTLEGFFIQNSSHEALSLFYMQALNTEFNGALTDAIAIFTNKHPRKFFNQLISSQLDMDRLDYLKRDSFYTGVVEGSINSDRLIAMLHVKDDELVIEHKGIYSIEKFLQSRRFMYWQVYLHKTGLLAEKVLLLTLQRARKLLEDGISVLANGNIIYFLKNAIDNLGNNEVIERFATLDDYDVWSALKEWQLHDDFVLSNLAKSIIQRKLPRIELSDTKFTAAYIDQVSNEALKLPGIDEGNLKYFSFTGKVSNQAYDAKNGTIKVLLKNGTTQEWLSVDSNFNSTALSEPMTKYYLVYPKKIVL